MDAHPISFQTQSGQRKVAMKERVKATYAQNTVMQVEISALPTLADTGALLQPARIKVLSGRFPAHISIEIKLHGSPLQRIQFNQLTTIK
jgi:hypothetical protein